MLQSKTMSTGHRRNTAKRVAERGRRELFESSFLDSVWFLFADLDRSQIQRSDDNSFPQMVVIKTLVASIASSLSSRIVNGADDDSFRSREERRNFAKRSCAR